MSCTGQPQGTVLTPFIIIIFIIDGRLLDVMLSIMKCALDVAIDGHIQMLMTRNISNNCSYAYFIKNLNKRLYRLSKMYKFDVIKTHR